MAKQNKKQTRMPKWVNILVHFPDDETEDDE